ncbi:MAG: hypothetical protein ACRC3Z_09740 [Phocaeicola sp.]
MADEKLLTVEEFNNQVTKWAMNIRQQARGTLSRTRGKGNLRVNLTPYVDKLSGESPAYKIKFDFNRYGVFRAYGVGRGYIMMNGAVVRGYRVRSEGEIRKRIFLAEASEMLKRGYSTREVNAAKKVLRTGQGVERTPLDWIDGHIDRNVQALADLVQDFYGDDALRNMIANFDNIKIKKK